jgi:hypothetical protein
MVLGLEVILVQATVARAILELEEIPTVEVMLRVAVTVELPMVIMVEMPTGEMEETPMAVMEETRMVGMAVVMAMAMAGTATVTQETPTIRRMIKKS